MARVMFNCLFSAYDFEPWTHNWKLFSQENGNNGNFFFFSWFICEERRFRFITSRTIYRLNSCWYKPIWFILRTYCEERYNDVYYYFSVNNLLSKRLKLKNGFCRELHGTLFEESFLEIKTNFFCNLKKGKFFTFTASTISVASKISCGQDKDLKFSPIV